MPALPGAGLYIIRVIKALGSAPLNQWANTYEFQADDPVSVGDLTVLASAVALFEQTITHNVVQFNRAVVSSWVPDSVPYDPATFLVVPLTATGSIGPVTDALPLNQCLRVVRSPATGRAGHLFYRQALEEGDVTAPAGFSVLTNLSGIDDNIQAALASSELEGYIGDTPLGPLHMVMVDAAGMVIRNVLSLSAQGVTTLPTDHAWFNRT